MLNRDQFCALLDISNDDLKNYNRRSLLPFWGKDRRRNEYSPFEAVLALMVDDLVDAELDRASAARIVDRAAQRLMHAISAIDESAKALARGGRPDEIFAEVVWVPNKVNGSIRVEFVGTLREISDELIRWTETYRAFPVRGVLMNATRAFVELSDRASRAGIIIDWNS